MKYIYNWKLVFLHLLAYTICLENHFIEFGVQHKLLRRRISSFKFILIDNSYVFPVSSSDKLINYVNWWDFIFVENSISFSSVFF